MNSENIRPAVRGSTEKFLSVAVTIVLIVIAIGAAYHDSFSGPFVFDDVDSITDNPSIRQFSTAWWPRPTAGGATVAGRPVVNLSLALNYAIGGESVWSYHGVNLLVHTGGAVLLFGLVLLTLESPALRERFGAAAVPLAGVVAMLWALHPLQTESVTYIVQRAESLMGFFYLLTLFAFAWSVSSARRGLWAAVSVFACWAGMATKEVMVSAPVIVLLYDRTFASGTFSAALAARGRYYGALAGSWILMLGLNLATDGRGSTAGFGVDISWWQYGLTQCWAVVHYLRLCVWPSPLVFDYGTWAVSDLSSIWPQALLLAAAGVATLWSLRHRPVWGFLGAFFFAVLAPSSSFIPVATQTVAEHRMYLPLAAVVTGFVIVGHALAGRRSLALWVILSVVCGTYTFRRNVDYRSHVALWMDTAEKRPDNAFARYNLAVALQTEGRYAEAVPEYEAAIRLIPDYIEAHTNLAATLQQLGRWDEAEKQYQQALRYDPRPVETLAHLGGLLLERERWEEAGRVYARLLELDPERVDARVNIAQVLFALGRERDALDQLEVLLQSAPESADARLLVATTLLQWKQFDRARQQFEIVLQLRPNDTAARAGLARLAAQSH